MLVLGRRAGQRIMIGDDIIISVEEAHGGAARIGIKAPKETKILREELIIKDQEKKDGSDRLTNSPHASTRSNRL